RVVGVGEPDPAPVEDRGMRIPGLRRQREFRHVPGLGIYPADHTGGLPGIPDLPVRSDRNSVRPRVGRRGGIIDDFSGGRVEPPMKLLCWSVYQTLPSAATAGSCGKLPGRGMTYSTMPGGAQAGAAA